MIGLDAMEWSLIEHGIAAGTMPTFARLRDTAGLVELDDSLDQRRGITWMRMAAIPGIAMP